MTKWEKTVAELGLVLMRPNIQKERINALMEGNTIHADKVAALLDECAAGLMAFVDKNEDAKPEDEIEMIRSMLRKIDGKDAVASSTADELAEWVMGLMA